MEETHNIPKDIKQVSEVCWEIPTSYKKDMLVPARIYATEKLLKGMDAGVFEQVTNVACLPGIQKYAFCMPDGHWGYGFPIGGVAAMDAEEGVISPGGVGFDINCIHPDTRISTSFGYFRKIKDMEMVFPEEELISFDPATKHKKSTFPILFLKKKADNKILRIKTFFGEELILSEDHPIYNGKEWVQAGLVSCGNNVMIYPFVGVEYEKPEDKVILDEKDIIAVIGPRKKVINELKGKGLLPLSLSSKKFPLLARLVGFLTGDGWIGSYFSKKRNQEVWSARVIGTLSDLELVKRDINELGYECNYCNTKRYKSSIKNSSGIRREIDGYSTQLYVSSQSLSILLHVLGVPKGNKSRVITRLPPWIRSSPLWIKRLYLAGLFGAELTKPLQRKGEQYTFIEPNFSQNKINLLERDNMNFMLDVINLLQEFGIRVNKIYRQKGVINKYGEETQKLALRLSATAENLIKLWGSIGYEYCLERKILSLRALSYLKYKQQVLAKSNEYQGAVFSLGEGKGLQSSLMRQQQLCSNTVRISKFPTFVQFIAEQDCNNEFILDKIMSIEEKPYEGMVYDFMMGDKDHNFIANSLVSHNCGMRALVTNLTYKDVQPKLREVVDLLFKRVPSGVGGKGFVKVTKGQFDEIVTMGPKWCIEQGMGWAEDLERTEENGCIAQANPEKISDKAIQRGIGQLGTLGSGNHYLEIQTAANIFDAKVAKRFGITEENQIVVMVHCGSRGFGHQVATDYLKTFLDVMPKYGIIIRDKELACAPYRSDEGQNYYQAMACAANMAFANRQVIAHRIRECFSTVFKKSPEDLGMHQVYDVAHNIPKVEDHKINGTWKKVVVHRKGATRCFGPGEKEVPKVYEDVGQPVIIGGSMETGSYLLVGMKNARDETFGSTAHGSGRTMSRTQAKQEIRGDALQKDMEKRGIYVKSASMSGLAEEAGFAYKDISEVVDTMEKAGVSKKVVALRPIGNVKG